MSNGFYSHEKHIFDNPYSNIVPIEPPFGKTLIIDATIANPSAQGVDQSVQFNSLGDLAGDSSFLYDTINTKLTIPNVKTDYVFNEKSTDALGYSTIYQGINQTFPQDIVSQYSLLDNFGTDLQLAKSANYAAFACPNLGPGFPAPTEGGITVFNQAISGDPWAEYSSVLGYTGITDENFTSVGINEDGTKLALVDRLAGSIEVYNRSGATWNSVAKVSLDSQAVKITGAGTLLTCDSNSQYSVYTQSGASITLVQNLVNLATAFSETACLSIHNNALAFTRLGDLWCYTLSGTWGLAFTKSSAGYQSMDIYNTSGTDSLLVVVTPSALLAYENGVVVLNDVDTWDCVCTNGTYIFAFGSGSISIFSKVLGVWTKMTQTYSLAGVTKMSANVGFLAVSRSAINSGVIFSIQTYTNSQVTITEIDLNETDNKLHINADYGTDFGTSITTIPTLSSTTTTIDGRVILPAGELTDPAIQFSDSPDTGLFYSTNQVNTCVNGVTKLEVKSTAVTSVVPVAVPNGTVSAPSLAFSSDSNTGLYRVGADNIGITCNGIKQIDCGTVRTTFTNPILAPAGTAALPAIATGFNNCGLYQFGSAIGLSVSGVSQLTTDATHTVTTNPFKHLSNGSASVPSFSWVNSGNTGMYYDTNEVNFTVNGIRKLKISNTGATHTNSLRGLTSPTTTFDLGASAIDLGLGGSYRQRIGPSGNSLADISIGNGCNLASNNPTLGSVLRISTDGAGRWGTENIVTGGATQFHLFLATTAGVGSITTNGTTTSFNGTSSILLKKDIVDVDTSVELEKINNLRPVHFKWKVNDHADSGFIANEVEEVFPQCVIGTDNVETKDYKQLDTRHFTYALVASVQELKKQVEAMKLRMDAMQAEIDTFV